MSETVCTYPIVGAVRKADDIIGKNRIWRGINPTQLLFLKEFYTPEAVAEIAGIPELESIASFNAAEINHWLAERKFDIKLDPFPRHGFGTACMLDVVVQWLVTGEARPINLATGQQVPGVFLKEGLSFFTSPAGPGARISTKSGDIVSIMRFDNKQGLKGLDLALFIKTWHSQHINDYSGLYFPMVDLDQQPDISWLLEMETTGKDGHPYIIWQAKQQTKFRMNEVGARVKSAVAIGVMRGISVHRPKPPLIVDGPFLIWIERPGLSHPFFVGHITPEGMKSPGSLDSM